MSASLLSCMTIRDQLLGTGFYLADASTLDRVHWAVDGRKSILFEEPFDPTAESDLRPAVLTAILVLSDQRFFLTSDASWHGPSEITPRLYDVHASCIGVPPWVNPFHNDFSRLLVHAHALQAKVASHEETLPVGFVRNRSLKFQHGSLLLDEWPVNNEVATAELEKMKGSYRAIPIPAYDFQNNHIHPASYRNELRGALVEIHFTLSHFAFKNKDTLIADIQTLHVLHTPHTVSSIVKPRFAPSFERSSSSARSSFVQGKSDCLFNLFTNTF
ncbi:hypothetical protein JVT61DRAFT_10780 [Boletus reticuloceps]|uniref:Uncharacterized protein n=1 Tax=Boletus reticuloceps TaxID=495285 RepID=A0A8I2YG41_9AGAM|nr:hypothetical protein JVT61DRAFT_10780 [Boletus reticuloceps]